jgi:hypothetical protein
VHDATRRGVFVSRDDHADKVRATVTFTETAHAALVESAQRANLSVPDYIRRALALQQALSKYTDEHGGLVVVDQVRNREVHLQVVS